MCSFFLVMLIFVCFLKQNYPPTSGRSSTLQLRSDGERAAAAAPLDLSILLLLLLLLLSLLSFFAISISILLIIQLFFFFFFFLLLLINGERAAAAVPLDPANLYLGRNSTPVAILSTVFSTIRCDFLGFWGRVWKVLKRTLRSNNKSYSWKALGCAPKPPSPRLTDRVITWCVPRCIPDSCPMQWSRLRSGHIGAHPPVVKSTGTLVKSEGGGLRGLGSYGGYLRKDDVLLCM